jgi:hypothetical protein
VPRAKSDPSGRLALTQVSNPTGITQRFPLMRPAGVTYRIIDDASNKGGVSAGGVDEPLLPPDPPVFVVMIQGLNLRSLVESDPMLRKWHADRFEH